MYEQAKYEKFLPIFFTLVLTCVDRYFVFNNDNFQVNIVLKLRVLIKLVLLTSVFVLLAASFDNIWNFIK